LLHNSVFVSLYLCFTTTRENPTYSPISAAETMMAQVMKANDSIGFIYINDLPFEVTYWKGKLGKDAFLLACHPIYGPKKEPDALIKIIKSPQSRLQVKGEKRKRESKKRKHRKNEDFVSNFLLIFRRNCKFCAACGSSVEMMLISIVVFLLALWM
jgi:hypothetical protein